MYYTIMTKTASKNVIHKKRPGRKPTGHDPMIALRMPPEERAAIEAWAAQQPDKLTLSKALRRLVGMGLAAAAVKKPASPAAETARAIKAKPGPVRKTMSGDSKKAKPVKRPRQMRKR